MEVTFVKLTFSLAKKNIIGFRDLYVVPIIMRNRVLNGDSLLACFLIKFRTGVGNFHLGRA